MKLNVRKGWLTLALSMAVVTPALAADGRLGGVGATEQEIVVVDPQPQPWGGTSNTAQVIGVGDFQPPNDTVTWGTGVSGTNGIGLFQTSATQVDWWYGSHVPNGAQLVRVDAEACDTSATGGMQFGLASGTAPGGAAANISAVASTGVATTPGCAFFPMTPTATTNIANPTNNYWIFFDWTGTGFGPAIQLHSFRIFYRLQVSPAPAVASFPLDVPTTHPFFRFVEAMAASGLTGGCGAGSFCPDQAVTRGQLSVFLASALGLHFPN
jgi:hypothetical protein